MGKPPELTEAEMVDGLCRRYHCLPSQMLAEDGVYLLRMLAVLDAAGELGNNGE